MSNNFGNYKTHDKFSPACRTLHAKVFYISCVCVTLQDFSAVALRYKFFFHSMVTSLVFLALALQVFPCFYHISQHTPQVFPRLCNVTSFKFSRMPQLWVTRFPALTSVAANYMIKTASNEIQKVRKGQCQHFTSPSPQSTAFPTYLLIHNLFNLQWFDDVSDELWMHVRVADLLVKEHAHGVLWEMQQRKKLKKNSFLIWYLIELHLNIPSSSPSKNKKKTKKTKTRSQLDDVLCSSLTSKMRIRKTVPFMK